MQVLSSPKGRSELNRALRGSPSLGTVLLDHIATEYAFLFPEELAFGEKKGDFWQLDFERFESWLQAYPLDAADVPVLALLACGFAMSDNSLIPRLVDIVTEQEPLAMEWLVDGENGMSGELISDRVDTNIPTNSSNQTEDQGEMEFQNIDSEAVCENTAETAVFLNTSRPPATTGDDFICLAQQAEILHNGPIQRWRDWLQLLRQLIDDETTHIARLDETALAVRAAATDVAQLPILNKPLEFEYLGEIQDEATVVTEQARLTTLHETLLRVQRAYGQFEAMRERLGYPIERWLTGGATPLDTIAVSLEERTSALAAEIEEIGKAINRASNFLDQLATGDPVSASQIVDSMDEDTVRDLGRFIFDPTLDTETTKSRRTSLQSADLGGLLLAHALRKDFFHAAASIAPLLFECEPVIDLTRAATALSWLTFGQMQALAKQESKIASAIAVLIFVTAWQRDRAEFLEYLDPLLTTANLDPVAADFFQVLVEAWRRGRLPSLTVELLRAETAETEARAAEIAVESHQRRVLAWLDESPGMKKNFHLLRIYAQALYLEPLRVNIENGNAPIALQAWKAFGDIDSMVEVCIAQLSRKDKPEPRHYDRTRAYLADFEHDLTQWARTYEKSGSAAIPELTRSVNNLRRESPSHANAAAILTIIESAKTIETLPSDFGDRVGPDGAIAVSAELTESFLDPTQILSWPKAVEGAVPLVNLLADRLREGLLTEKRTLRHALDIYLQTGKYAAARRAAIGDEALESLVETALTRRREAVRTGHAEMLTEADKASDYDANIAEYRAEFERALASDDFLEVEAAIALLQECLTEYRHRNDPERKALLEWLAEANIIPSEHASAAELQTLTAKLRSTESARRQHLTVLKEQTEDERAAEPVRDIWTQVSQRLDRPAWWPDAETSEIIAGDLATTARLLRGKWNGRLSESDPSAIIARRVAAWVPEQLSAGLCPTGDQTALNRISELATKLHEGWGDAALLRFLGESTPHLDFAPQVTQLLPSPTVSPRIDAPERQAPSTENLGPKWDELLKSICSEPPSGAANFADLHSATRTFRWPLARKLAVAVLRATPPPGEDVRTDMLAIYGASLFEMQAPKSTVPDWLLETCIAIACSRRATSHWLGQKYTQEFIPRAMLRGLHRLAALHKCDTLSEHFGRTLAAAVELPATDGDYHWLSSLLRRCDVSAPRLASIAWDCFTGLRGNENYRAALLRLLFRNRQIKTLETLVVAAPERVQSLVRATLEAFVAAEMNPEAQPAALQLEAALRAQAVGVANTQPWLLLFGHLAQSLDSAEPASLEILLDSELVIETSNAQRFLEVRIQPDRSEPPRHLHLQLGTQPPVALFDEMLFSEQTFRVQLPPDMSFSADGDGRLAWSIETITSRDRKVTRNGVWTLLLTQPAQQLDPGLREIYWPGATCDPVKTNEGFFGRSREIREIEGHLHASPRARSVMIFGERRIGKTSLLQTLLTSFPPERGRLCGVFCDVSSLHLAPGESLPEMFFAHLLTALGNRGDNDNRLFVDAIGRYSQHPLDFRRLGRELDARTSLHAALTRLVEKLEEFTDGAVSRLVIFVDEFDRFVRLVLGNRREEVDSFMWELRQVIQRSNRIVLVLAGSGLQRILKENYQDALYGSIVEVELLRFNWAEDREAILDTFLPRDIRHQICRPEDFDRVGEYAAKVCGGHPMFLALLGSASSEFADGRYLTPSLLDRVVERMVHVESSDGQRFGRKTFYECVFQPLEVLPQQEYQLARGLFATLAQHTSGDGQFRIAQLLEISGLLRYADTRQLLQVLDRLEKAKAIVNDKTSARVRIAVPLTAAAVREDALIVRDAVDQALETLKEKR